MLSPRVLERENSPVLTSEAQQCPQAAFWLIPWCELPGQGEVAQTGLGLPCEVAQIGLGLPWSLAVRLLLAFACSFSG